MHNLIKNRKCLVFIILTTLLFFISINNKLIFIYAKNNFIFLLICTHAITLFFAIKFYINIVKNKKKLKYTQALYKDAINVTPYAIALYDHNDILIEHNKAYECLHKKYFKNPSKVITYRDLMSMAAPQLGDANKVEEWIEGRIKAQRAGNGVPIDRLYPDGKWLRVSKYKTRSDSVIGYGIDITDLKQRELELEDAEKRYNALTQVAPVGIWQLTNKGNTLFLNQAALDIFNLDAKTNTPNILSLIRVIQDENVIDELTTAKILLKGNDPINIEAQLSGDIKKSLYITRSKLLKSSEGESSYIYVILDVSSRKQAEDDIRYLARHDSLTGLVNRNHMNIRLKQLIKQNINFAFILIDLDFFKNINDSLGHQVGDQLLKEVSKRITSNLRDNDIAIRLGGDEFAIILPNTLDIKSAHAMLKRLYVSFDIPAVIENKLLHISVSAGMAIFPEHAKNIRDIIHHADIALYHQKSVGRGSYTVFENKLASGLQARQLLEQDLRRALTNNHELTVYYQPQYNLHDLSISGVEALVRWRNARTNTWVSPVDFIPTAEQSGLIFELDKFVLNTAASQVHAWHLSGFDQLTLASNLSTLHFKSDLFENMITKIIKDTQLDPRKLELEITEGLFLEDQDQAMQQLTSMRELGMRVAVDDFGTGYSSLGYLNNLPVDCLKIDRSFINNYLKSHYHNSIVKFIIDLGKNLDLDIVAEGIETIEQLEHLSSLKCSHGQGFYLSKPIPTDEMTRLLLNTKTKN